ncbi:MAG: methyltransferase domain-containing protein [Lachnospiraceae bacterium]|nr:methyltransferase domain-containing protein [Lachnospiraceae bacterium]
MNNRSFDHKRIAEGYKDRPFLHKQVIEQFQKDYGARQYENGLDVGCGAGLSAKALKLICKNVTGTDISPEMIAVAQEICGAEGFTFFPCKAEEVPCADTSYDIVTAAGVVQWVDRDAFLQNLRRIMSDDGVVVIYDFCISDRMEDCEAYSTWWHEQYLREFPKPYRNEQVWTQADVEPAGFTIVEQIPLTLSWEFDLDALINIMMIQSNVNVRIEGGEKSVSEAQQWFCATLIEFFADGKEVKSFGKRRIAFDGYRWILKCRNICSLL